MEITVRKHPAEAGARLVDLLASGGEAPQTWEGYQVLPVEDVPELVQEWAEQCNGPYESLEWLYPLAGKPGWERIYRKFGRWVETDTNSVHGGAALPDRGFAALDCDEFVVVLKQDVTDVLQWDWVWHPVYVIGSAD